MNTAQNLKPLNVPACLRCCCCMSVKVAVAWELTGVRSKSLNPCRYYCEACAGVKGFSPSETLKSRTLDKVGGLPKKCDRPKRKYIKKISA